jgi:hypothetical protein
LCKISSIFDSIAAFLVFVIIVKMFQSLNICKSSSEGEQNSRFFGREWAFQKLIREPGMVINSLNCSLVLAAVGCGKSALLQHVQQNPQLCSGQLLAYFCCSPTTNAFDFVFSVASQLQTKIPYLQVPSRKQLSQLYHYNHGAGSVEPVDSNEPTIASQCSVRSTIDRLDLESIDLLTTTTTSDRFMGSTSSFPVGSPVPAAISSHSTFALTPSSPLPHSSHLSRQSNVSQMSPMSWSPIPPAMHSNRHPVRGIRISPGSSADGGASVESGGTCTISTAAAYATHTTGSSAQLTSYSRNHRRHDIREDVFWRYVLEPIIDHGLNRWEDQCFLLLIDSIDEQPEICELLSRHLLLLPNYLHVIVTARPARRKGLL